MFLLSWKQHLEVDLRVKGVKFLLFCVCGSRIKFFAEDLLKRGTTQEDLNKKKLWIQEDLNKHKLWISGAKEKEKVKTTREKGAPRDG